MADLTEPQWRALAALRALVDEPRVTGGPPAGHTTPRQVAERLWPDSEAWHRRTRGRRTGTANGAVGGTMPMKGAQLLWRLWNHRYARLLDERDYRHLAGRPHNLWTITDAGRQALTEHEVRT